MDTALPFSRLGVSPFPLSTPLRARPDLGVPGPGSSRWVTRDRPKIERIACPWLIRRFVDPHAEFFFVPPSAVLAEAERLRAVPFDIPGVEITHTWERCSFDALMEAFGLEDPALGKLATIVRAADTDRPGIAPQGPGLLAISLGLSHLYPDDCHMLEAGMPIYDALYAWCAHCQDELHRWASHT